MTQKEAKELSLELWTYLAEHPEFFSKAQVPPDLFSRIKNLKSGCPLCALFYDSNCEGCPLYTEGEACVKEGSVYSTWEGSLHDDKNTRKDAALRIAEIIRAWEPEEAR
jgi:hypothetical protein